MTNTDTKTRPATKGETVTYTLPAYWASYLINGDSSGINSHDEYFADKFLADRNLQPPVSCSEESWFSHRNDSDNRLGGDVLEYTFLMDGKECAR